MKLKPAVPRRWLILLAGLLWGIVGLLLCRQALIWLKGAGPGQGSALGAGALFLAWVVYRRGFSAIVLKNMDRLDRLSGKSCIFGFQAWKSYILIIIMISLGMLLRHSAIPRPYLAVCYMVIGGALLLSSVIYFKRFWQAANSKRPEPPAGNNPPA
ncbi:MAG: hypothetical protein AB1427_19360 [Thermodesulfobacteriota bacterium]